MSQPKRIKAPFDKNVSRELRAGDLVLLSGDILCARDAVHKALANSVSRGEGLPISLENETIYYMGPSPKKPNEIVGSAGPTTSGRMDKYTPMMIENGISAMIGKGYRSKEVVDLMVKYGVVYMVAIGGAGAYIANKIKKYEVLLYPELGAEALARLSVEDFPVIVAIDSFGQNYYEIGQRLYKK